MTDTNSNFGGDIVWRPTPDEIARAHLTRFMAAHGSRDAFRLAFKRGLREDGETWMDMIKSRTLTSHTYNEDVADKIAADILNRYYSEFVALQTTMESLKEERP